MGGILEGTPREIGNQLPVAAVQVASLSHRDLVVRRFCLFVLDHYGRDASDTLRRVLCDPVASVREAALQVSPASGADPKRFASPTLLATYFALFVAFALALLVVMGGVATAGAHFWEPAAVSTLETLAPGVSLTPRAASTLKLAA